MSARKKLDMRVSSGRTDARIKQLEKTIRKLIRASDNLTGAIEGVTDQFDPQKEALMDATGAAEKLLQAGAA